MLPITRNELKELLRIPADEAGEDSRIDSHLARSQPAVEFRIAEEYLADTADTGLQALLKLGVAEVLAGEYAALMAGEAGASEAFRVASIQIGERKPDPAGLRAQGWARLEPFLKGRGAAQLWSSTLGRTRDFEEAQDELREAV